MSDRQHACGDSGNTDTARGGSGSGQPRQSSLVRWLGVTSLLGLGLAVGLAWPRPAQPAHPQTASSISAAELPLPRDAGLSLDEFDSSLALELQLDGADSDPLMAYAGWSTWPDGGAVPPLPPTAPHAVRFGAALFPYAGSEFAPRDAPARDEALKQAEAAIVIAQTDFGKAVKLSHGGGEDLGLMHRGILEPPVEYALFSLKVGAVYPRPVDTPRGYWVLRRIR